MPLHATLDINGEDIGQTMKVCRLEDLKPGREWYPYRYRLTVKGRAVTGTVRHRYDDGGWALVRRVLNDAHKRKA